jgi:hypothetical protein
MGASAPILVQEERPVLYTSKYADLQVLVRSPVTIYHPSTGVAIDSISALTANFGSHGGTFNMVDPFTGNQAEYPIIHGHFFDSEEAAERLEWTPEELESVEKTLDRLAKEQPYLLAKVDMNRPAAALPWPTYENTDWRKIPDFAEQLGLVPEALAYERENKNRDTVVEKLEEKLTTAPLPVEQEAEAITL